MWDKVSGSKSFSFAFILFVVSYLLFESLNLVNYFWDEIFSLKARSHYLLLNISMDSSSLLSPISISSSVCKCQSRKRQCSLGQYEGWVVANWPIRGCLRDSNLASECIQVMEIDITVNKRSANDPAPRRKIFFTNGKEAFLIFGAILNINIRLWFLQLPLYKEEHCAGLREKE